MRYYVLSMNDGEAKLKKLRTFYDDVTKVQSGSPNEAFSSETKADPLLKARIKDTQISNLQLEEVGPSKPIQQSPIKEISLPPIKPAPVPTPLTTIPKIDMAAEKSSVDLQNKIDVSALRQNASDSLLSGHGAIFSTIEEGNETETGNIITDQKRDRFKLFPAIGQALSEWFFKQKKVVTKMLETKEVGPEISDVTTRENVLKDAALRSALAPKDDYTNVAKRIKNIAKVSPTPTTLVIKKPTETAAPGWTYIDDEKSRPESNPEPVTELVLPKTQTINPVIEIPKVEPVIINQPELIIESQTPLVELPTEAPIIEAPEIPEPAIDTAIIKEEPVADHDWFASSVESPTISADHQEPIVVSSSPVPARTYAPSDYQNSFPLWRVGAVATLAILLGISLTLWLFKTDETVVVVNNENPFTALLNADEEVPVDLGRDNQTLLRNIQAVQPRPTSAATIVYPTTNISGVTEAASAADIINVTSWQAPGSFVRGVTDINFGIYKNSNPFIVLKVTSFDTAFGGILEWERTMSADLSPLFGTPVFGTFDPLARTATQIRDPYYVDVVVSNIDSRLLTDETQKERIIYAFADRNTIIITTSKSTLGDLLNLLR